MSVKPTSAANIQIKIQQQDFDLAAEYDALRQASVNPGAVVLFTGLVRDVVAVGDLGSVDSEQQSLTLEHYPGMTENALHAIAGQAAERWPLMAISIIHRVGTLLPGDQIVLVAASSAHRQAAFESADFMMDYLKTSAPFWKKQQSGDSSHWVESRESDYRAAARWRPPQK